MEITEIYEEMMKADVPISSWQSDLYAKVCEDSVAIVNNYVFKDNVKMFFSQVDNEVWFDIPFAYDPFWDRLSKIHDKIIEERSQ